MAKTKTEIMSAKDKDLTPAELKKRDNWLAKEALEKAEALKEEKDAAIAEKKAEKVAEAESRGEDLKVEEDLEDDVQVEKKEEPATEVAEEGGELEPWTENFGEKDLVKDIKHTRKVIDGVIKTIGQSNNDFLDVSKSLFLGKAWLGQLLNAIGNKNPYANEHKIKNRADIPKTADEVELDSEFWANFRPFSLKNKELQIVELRVALDAILESVASIREVSQPSTRETAICITQTEVNLVEAKIFLGQELGKLSLKK